MRRINQNVIYEFENFIVQAVIEHARQLHGGVAGRKVGTAHISDKKRIAG